MSFLLFCAFGTAPATGTIVEPARPAPRVTPELPASAPSFVRIPIRIPLDFLRDGLDATIPSESASGEGFDPYSDGVEVRYRVWRDPFELEASSDRVRVRANFLYWMEARGPGFEPTGCGRPDAPLSGIYDIHFRFGWRDGWGLDARDEAGVTGYQDRCKPNPPDVNFTKDLISARVHGEMLEELGDRIESTMRADGRVRAIVEDAWATLAEPVALPQYGMWLAFHPTGIVASPITGDGDGLTTELAIEVWPRMNVGTQPEVKEPPLPETRVRLFDEKVAVSFDCGVPFDSLASAIRVRCAGLADMPTRVTEVDVSGLGDRVLITLGVEGVLQGTLYLAGAPNYDPDSFWLGVPDLAYTEETLQAVSGGTSPSEGGDDASLSAIRDAVSAGLETIIKDGVIAYVGQLGRALNSPLSPTLHMKGGTNERRVVGTFVSDRVMGVRLLAAGGATLRVDPD